MKILVEQWAVLFGFPKRILADRPTSFGGPLWQSICHTLDVELTLAPARAAHQIGLAERHVHIIKMSYNALWRANTDNWTRRQILALSCIAKNSTPLCGGNMPPNLLTIGKDDLAHRYAHVQPPIRWATDTSPDALHYRRLTALINMRSDMLRWGARFMTRVALTKSLRKGANQVYKINQPVQVWSSFKKVCGNGFRLVAETGRNGILERGRRLIKAPLIWIRPKSDFPKIEEPSSGSSPSDQPECTQSRLIDSSATQNIVSVPANPPLVPRGRTSRSSVASLIPGSKIRLFLNLAACLQLRCLDRLCL